MRGVSCKCLALVFVVVLNAPAILNASALAATFTDAAGRKVELPAKVERVYAAGPPASMAVFAISPDKLIGWTHVYLSPHLPFGWFGRFGWFDYPPDANRLIASNMHSSLCKREAGRDLRSSHNDCRRKSPSAPAQALPLFQREACIATIDGVLTSACT